MVIMLSGDMKSRSKISLNKKKPQSSLSSYATSSSGVVRGSEEIQIPRFTPHMLEMMYSTSFLMFY